MPKTIKFRQEAVRQMSSPDQLEQLIRVVTPQSVLISITLYALLAVVFIWSILGTIPTRVEGEGIMLAGGGDIYAAVAPDGPSYIQHLLIEQGDKVKKGQVIATLARPDLLDQIKVTQRYLNELQQKKIQLQTLSQQEITARQKEIEQQKKSLQRTLITSREKEKHLVELLAIKQAAFKKGIEIRQNVEQTYQEYYSIKNEIESYTNKLLELDIDQANFDDQWRERLRNLGLKITDETVKLNNLKIRLQLSGNVTSPVTGLVTDIRVSVGSIVNTGAPLINIASAGKELDALIFLSPYAGKRIKVGMEALISPNTVERAEYGSIYGQVIRVTEFPITSQAMIAALQNQELAKQFTQKDVPIAIRVHLQSDLSTISQLKWTSSQGPPLHITPGTLVKAMITIREQAPITLIIPALKKIMGIV